MAKHIFKGQGAPSFAPRQVGHHYVDTLNGIHYLSTGTASPTDWQATNTNVISVNGQTGVVSLVAADIPSTPAGDISSTNVQAALNELDSEKQPLDGDLTAIAALSGTGLIVRTAANTATTRTIAGTASNISVSNGDGVSGNPTIDLINAGTAGTYGSASQVPVFTTDAKGRVTGVTNTSIAITRSQVTDFPHASTHLPSGSDPLTTAAPAANLTAATSNSTGVANSLARSDHSHAIDSAAASAQTPDQVNAAGTSSSLARADHVHNIPTAAASSLSTSSTNTQGSAASFARSDHTHAISIVNSEASATADTTTTSSSDVLMNSMTLTPVAGTYLVWFSTSLKSSGTNADVRISIYSGGSQVAHTERLAVPQFSAGGLGGTPNIPIPIATHCVVTVNGSQAIEARWRRSAGTATAHQRTLNIIKLSN